jgi:prevent-host-death family protein
MIIMQTFTANDAKQHLGSVINTAIHEPVTITRHGKPAVVITSDTEYQELMQLKYAKLKSDIQSGVGSLDQGKVSKRTSSDILNDVLKAHGE